MAHAETFQTYKDFVKTTMKPGSPREQAEHFTLGLIGELGEVSEPIKKFLYAGAELDKAAVSREVGDMVWYVFALSEVMGCSPLPNNIQDPVQDLCHRAVNFRPGWSVTTLLLTSLGMVSELAYCAFEFIRGAQPDEEKFENIASTLLGMLAVLCDKYLDCTFGEVLDRNVAKLVSRYPELFTDTDDTEEFDY